MRTIIALSPEDDEFADEAYEPSELLTCPDAGRTSPVRSYSLKPNTIIAAGIWTSIAILLLNGLRRSSAVALSRKTPT